jgi:hypothetical protein
MDGRVLVAVQAGGGDLVVEVAGVVVVQSGGWVDAKSGFGVPVPVGHLEERKEEAWYESP